MIPYIPECDKDKYLRWLDDLQNVLMSRWNRSVPVIKFYIGTDSTVYLYTDTNADTRYTEKVKWTHDINKDEFSNLYDILTTCIGMTDSIKYTRLTKHANGYRLRLNFDSDSLINCSDYEIHNVIRALFALARQAVKGSHPTDKPGVNIEYAPNSIIKECRKEKKMNDFSLTNLKNALVDKVTHLDRKTVSILAIIALILLVVGKYNTIKGLIVGIKDKVTGSDDFKAMITDGTKAIDSLKKIVGVKPADTKAKSRKD